jgi:hypothetical protein
MSPNLGFVRNVLIRRSRKLPRQLGVLYQLATISLKLCHPVNKQPISVNLPELTITSPYFHSRVDFNTFTMGNPMPESTLTASQGLWIWPLLPLYLLSLTSPTPPPCQAPIAVNKPLISVNKPPISVIKPPISVIIHLFCQ